MKRYRRSNPAAAAALAALLALTACSDDDNSGKDAGTTKQDKGGGSDAPVVDSAPAADAGPKSILTFDPTAAQTLKGLDGAQVDLPANALELPGGGAPQGQVTATIKVRVGSWSTPRQMPGGFAGKTKGGQSVTLISYGVIEAKFTDSKGQLLNLKSGMKAKLTIPALVAGPAQIPLWYLDEKTNIWQEDGTATLDAQGKNYVGDVTHFSKWNVDDQCLSACIQGTVKDSTGKPVESALVVATLTDTTCTKNNWTPGALSGGYGSSTSAGTYKIKTLARSSTYKLKASAYFGGKVMVATKTVKIPDASSGCIVVDFTNLKQPADEKGTDGAMQAGWTVGGQPATAASCSKHGISKVTLMCHACECPAFAAGSAPCAAGGFNTNPKPMVGFGSYYCYLELNTGKKKYFSKAAKLFKPPEQSIDLGTIDLVN